MLKMMPNVILYVTSNVPGALGPVFSWPRINCFLFSDAALSLVYGWMDVKALTSPAVCQRLCVFVVFLPH